MGSRGAQQTELDSLITIGSFNTWAREEPNLATGFYVATDVCFNTWAREEPNSRRTIRRTEMPKFQYLGSRGAQLRGAIVVFRIARVSILGLARSPTSLVTILSNSGQKVSILGLARSPTIPLDHQPRDGRVSILGLARSPTAPSARSILPRRVSILGLARSPTYAKAVCENDVFVSILGLARSPTAKFRQRHTPHHVSILGLARSPTRFLLHVKIYLQFQYLGSRGAQRKVTLRSNSVRRFNTWAREEPNLRTF